MVRPPDELDPEPTEAELREAEALARALDDGRAHAHLPADAWQAALLLRSDHPIPEPRDELALARRRRMRRGVWAGAIALAATVVLAVGLNRGGADLPRPSASLLAAQASASSDGGRTLEREMRTHRRALLSELERHYRSDP